MKITKANLLERIEALENENKQRGIGNQFMTLKCIQGNRHFTKDATYCASKLFDCTVITTNFGSRKKLTVNTNIFGGYKVTGENQTAVFQVIGADVEPEPLLKRLDQSIFDGLEENWQFAAVDSDTSAYVYEARQHIEDNRDWFGDFGMQKYIGTGYDASNWQNSLIERDIAKKLTGSELCKAMLARGDKYVMCLVGRDADPHCHNHSFKEIAYKYSNLERCFFLIGGGRYKYATPINNQGEPLTKAEAGL